MRAYIFRGWEDLSKKEAGPADAMGILAENDGLWAIAFPNLSSSSDLTRIYRASVVNGIVTYTIPIPSGLTEKVLWVEARYELPAILAPEIVAVPTLEDRLRKVRESVHQLCERAHYGHFGTDERPLFPVRTPIG